MAQKAQYSKSSHLYSLLKRRPVSEKPKIVEILRETANTVAAEIIEGL